MGEKVKERGEKVTEESFLLPHFKTFKPKNVEEVLIGDPTAVGRRTRERARLIKHQETITKCEGIASYQYHHMVDQAYRPTQGEDVLERLPEEAPMPAPAIGMRLYKWPDTRKKPDKNEALQMARHEKEAW